MSLAAFELDRRGSRLTLEGYAWFLDPGIWPDWPDGPPIEARTSANPAERAAAASAVARRIAYSTAWFAEFLKLLAAPVVPVAVTVPADAPAMLPAELAKPPPTQVAFLVLAPHAPPAPAQSGMSGRTLLRSIRHP